MRMPRNIYRRKGKTRCDALTAELSQNFVNTLIERNGLSATTAQSIFIFLKASVVSSNASIFDVKMPKKTKPQVEFLSVNEQKRLEKATKKSGETDYIAIMLTIYMGVRLGELAGLMWTRSQNNATHPLGRRSQNRTRSAPTEKRIVRARNSFTGLFNRTAPRNENKIKL